MASGQWTDTAAQPRRGVWDPGLGPGFCTPRDADVVVKDRPVQESLSWVCVSEPCLRVSYTGAPAIPGSSLPRSLSPALLHGFGFCQADVGAAGGKYRLLWLAAGVPPQLLPSPPAR